MCRMLPGSGWCRAYLFIIRVTTREIFIKFSATVAMAFGVNKYGGVRVFVDVQWPD